MNRILPAFAIFLLIFATAWAQVPLAWEPPAILQFITSADTVNEGQPVVLSWKIRGAVTVASIADNVGSGPQAITTNEGSITIHPRNTAVYILKVANR